MSTVRIRRATAADATAMAELLAQLGYPANAGDLPGRLRAVEAEGGAIILAIDDAGAPIGLAQFAKHATIHAEAPVAYITALVTSASVRGRGVGRALVNAAEDWAREQGCVKLSVTSAEHRADAHAFYPKCGMPYTGRRFSKIL
jgi:GNAT superfamily N-acetyltransferase